MSAQCAVYARDLGEHHGECDFRLTLSNAGLSLKLPVLWLVIGRYKVFSGFFLTYHKPVCLRDSTGDYEAIDKCSNFGQLISFFLLNMMAGNPISTFCNQDQKPGTRGWKKSWRPGTVHTTIEIPLPSTTVALR